MLIRGILKQKLFPACAYFFESEIQEILWFWGECFWMCFLLLKEAENELTCQSSQWAGHQQILLVQVQTY